MANGFSKEEVVAFDQLLEGFQDGLIVSDMFRTYRTNQETMERANDTIWRPQPYIMTSYSGGGDMSSNFKDVTQLSVPASISNQTTVPWTLTAKQLRDMLQEGRLGQGARDKVASDINIQAINTASAYGSIVIKRTVAATGYDDISLADAAMTEVGIEKSGRVFGLSPRDYNAMAGTLGKPQTSGLQKTATAYEKAYLGNVSGFETVKLDYANRLAAAAGVTVTITNSSPLYYTPAATTVGADGVPRNVDNRFQTISINVTSGTVAVGDCFTIAGVNSVHHITKQDTGQPKTFRITAIVTGAGGTGTVTITPPIISNGGSTNAEAQYKNVSATPTNGAAITFLNTAAASQNVFWAGDCMELLPGRLVVPEGSGVAVLRGTTDNGMEMVMTKFTDINTLTAKYRIDSLFGTVCLNSEMAGIMLFSQS